MMKSKSRRPVSTNRDAVRSGCAAGLCEESKVRHAEPTPIHFATATGEVESVLRKAGGVICQEPLTEASLMPRPATVPSAPIRAAGA